MYIAEEIALAWLIKGKYKEEEIIYCHKVPKFVTIDGQTYEPKKMYGNTILIGEDHIERLKDTTIIVVDTNKRRVVCSFPFSQREEMLTGINVKIVDFKKGHKTLRVSQKTIKGLTALRLQDQTMDEIIQDLISSARQKGVGKA